MRQRALLILLLACVMGGAAVFLARGWLERQTVNPVTIESAPQQALTTVVVAKTPLRFGDELNRENLRVTNWPSDSVPEGAFTSVEDLLGANERRVALREIGVNETVLKSRVSGFGGRATLSAIIGPDMRAVTIRVNDVHGVAGFVLPGDHVDVLFTRPAGAGTENASQTPPITDVLLQNLKVLGVDQVADSQKEQPVVAKAVTLEVSTAQAQKIALATQVGTLSLVLRNTADIAVDQAGTVTVNGLLSAAADPQLAMDDTPPVTPAHTVRVVRGVEESRQDVVTEGAPKANPTSRPPAAKPAAQPSPDGIASAPLVTGDTKLAKR